MIVEFAAGWLNNMWFEKEGVPMIYKIILLEMTIALLINVVLNFYWSFLIVRQLYRLLTVRDADQDFAGDIKVENLKEMEMQKNDLLDPNQPQSDLEQPSK